MRLIDADKYKSRIMDIIACWNISPCLSFDEQRKSVQNLKTALNVLEEMPTAFDLESVIEKLENIPTKTIETYSEGYPMDEEFFCVVDVMKILKSAENATNGKNGG